jgi:hypothetical protein
MRAAPTFGRKKCERRCPFLARPEAARNIPSVAGRFICVKTLYRRRGIAYLRARQAIKRACRFHPSVPAESQPFFFLLARAISACCGVPSRNSVGGKAFSASAVLKKTLSDCSDMDPMAAAPRRATIGGPWGRFQLAAAPCFGKTRKC